MEQNVKPVLTIGMIVKNEIRCLERCLKAFEPLRKALPCELIIADTGSDDGTRKIAEKYADLVFDFPWINDFAAARNSVLDKAHGEWFLTVDADEYLDEDCEELINYLKNPDAQWNNFCGVIIRNYGTTDLIGPYSDFMAIRMVRMSTGTRYRGAIHEMWDYDGNLQIHGLRKTVFHHDGYVGFGTEAAKEKQKRNMDLLKAELKKDPHNLKTLMQAIDSSVGTDDNPHYIRMALKGIRRKNPGWKELGPVIFRSAVNMAHARKLDEFEDWVKESEQLFPDSLYTNISINHTALTACFTEKDYPEVIRRGERYLQTIANYNSGNFNPAELCVSTLDVSPEYEDTIRILTADACFHEQEYTHAWDLLMPIDGSRLAPGQVSNYMSVMLNLQAQSTLDVQSHISVFWEQISSETPKKDWGMLRRNAVIAQAARAFTLDLQAEEDKNGFRHAYTLFLPLKDECELGIAACVLEETDPKTLENLLCRVRHWEELPITVLSYALRHGIRFPLPDKHMEMEEMDVLAVRLAEEKNDILHLIQNGAAGTPIQSLAWKKALAMAAVRTSKWADGEQSMELARTFAKIEHEFLRFSYTTEALLAENLSILPPMHRFGWYCSQAFEALDCGDAAEYVRYLRKGLSTYGGMKPMVQFLTEHTPQLQTPSQELLELADKVRGMLAAFAPDDPAVAAIKQSPVYRKVAYLIEGLEAPVFGGLKQ